MRLLTLPLLVLSFALSGVASAQTASELCAAVKLKPYRMECLALVENDRAQCNYATDPDSCIEMLKFARVPSTGSSCTRVAEARQSWCKIVAKRYDTDCTKKFSDSAERAACVAVVAALVKHDEGGTTGLLSIEAFRKQTKLSWDYFKPRDQILSVEQALADYNRKLDGDPGSLEKMHGLVEVWEAADEYKSLTSGKRDVSALVTTARNEMQEVVDALVTQGDQDAFNMLRSWLAEFEELGSSSPFPAASNYIIGIVTIGTKAVQRKLGDEGKSSLQRRDLAELNDFDGAPAETQEMMEEMVELARSRVLRLVDTEAGSSAGVDPTGRADFQVVYGQNQPDDVRLGTLVHELTHVAAIQAFNNTPIMFSYPRGKTVEEIKQIQATRESNIRRLITLAKDSTLTPRQLKWVVDDKLEYSLTKETGKVLQGLMPLRDTDADAKTHFDYADSGGMTQVLWEYETVLNQILVYLAHWKIPESDAFHQAVMSAATEAQEERRSAK